MGVDFVVVNDAFVQAAFEAQLDHLRIMLNEMADPVWAKARGYGRYPFTDDGHDYLDTALDLAAFIRMVRAEGYMDPANGEPAGDFAMLAMMLNEPDDYEDEYPERGHNIVRYGACDGIAGFWYNLNCAALPREE